jgi:hypothetical protein
MRFSSCVTEAPVRAASSLIELSSEMRVPAPPAPELEDAEEHTDAERERGLRGWSVSWLLPSGAAVLVLMVVVHEETFLAFGAKFAPPPPSFQVERVEAELRREMPLCDSPSEERLLDMVMAVKPLMPLAALSAGLGYGLG